MSFAISVNPTHPTIAEFIPWAQAHPDLVHDAISLGHMKLHLYGKKKSCPAVAVDIVLTDDIKEYKKF
jgi:hypothetical protein